MNISDGELHGSRKEGGIAEDIKDILGGRDKECFALLDMNAVDMRFAPEADNDHKSISVQIYLRRHLHHKSVDREIRAMDEFGVGFGGVIRSAILRPHAVVDSLFRLRDMQFAGIAMFILASEIIDTIGDIRSLLYLHEEIAGADSMQPSCREEKEISLVRFVGSNHVLEGRNLSPALPVREG